MFIQIYIYIYVHVCKVDADFALSLFGEPIYLSNLCTFFAVSFLSCVHA